jgi:hypothetical protein
MIRRSWDWSPYLNSVASLEPHRNPRYYKEGESTLVGRFTSTFHQVEENTHPGANATWDDNLAKPTLKRRPCYFVDMWLPKISAEETGGFWRI